MWISKTTTVILTSMLLLSIFLAHLALMLSTEVTTKNDSGTVKLKHVAISDTPNNLVWFLQISDIHISIFKDPMRITQLREFCENTVDSIKPSVVLASGDLTDAKTKDSIGSRQFEDEWKYYKAVLKECNVVNKTTWLDIRGNHDNFNVAEMKSKENFYSRYSVQGKNHPRSYMHQIRKGNEVFSFIGIDACLDPGPRRPFNFVGMVSSEEMKYLNSLADRADTTGNHTIWFGHFPTSCILAPPESSVRNLIGRHKQGYAYLCGHLHQLGGLVPRMYTLQQAGFLELELGDWKDNRMFRLLAIDHGMFSFIDLQHGKWPITLITNPKHALFMIPGKENYDTILNSTHIRVLAFSLVKIVSVRIRINEGSWQEAIHSEGPLYVLPWSPSLYKSGLHYIEVYVKDVDDRESIVGQPFSLDGTRMAFGLFSRLALMCDMSTIFKLMFATTLVASVAPLCIFRYLHKLVKDGKISKPSGRRGCLRTWSRKLWILSTVDRIFWPLVLYPIYLCIGPWSIGHIIEEHLGVIFAWGIYVNGTFLPGSFTYAYGFLQLVTFQIPLTLILANGVDNRFQFQTRQCKSKTICGHITHNLPFIIILCIQLLMAYFFWLAYGTLAFILGPLRTWSVLLAVILWHQAISLPEKCTRDAANVWNSTVKAEDPVNFTDLNMMHSS